jgi:hypothetical protein
MADLLSNIPATFGLGGINIDAATAFIMQTAFVAGIAFIVILVMWRTKWYKRLLYSYNITVLYWDHRKANSPLQIDQMRKKNDKGLEIGELLHKDERMPFPSFSELHQFGKKIVYFAHRLETGVWLPVKVNLANPSAEIISELKDMKYSTNLKNVLDRETRMRYQSTSILDKLMPFMLPVAMAIFILLALYANYTYVWTPMMARVDAEKVIIDKLASLVSSLGGNTTAPAIVPVPPG